MLPDDGVDLRRVDVVDTGACHASSGDVCVVSVEFGVVAYAFAYDVGEVVVREDVEVFGGPFAQVGGGGGRRAVEVDGGVEDAVGVGPDDGGVVELWFDVRVELGAFGVVNGGVDARDAEGLAVE